MKLIHKKKLAQNRHTRKFNPKKLHISISYPQPKKDTNKSKRHHVRKVKFKKKDNSEYFEWLKSKYSYNSKNKSFNFFF